VGVDLVSMPQGRPLPPPPSAEPKRPSAESKPVKHKKKAVPIPAKQPEPETTTSSAPKPVKLKRSLKKKTYNASKAITSAIAKIKKKSGRSRPSNVLQAIDRLKQQEQQRQGAAETDGVGLGRTGKSAKALELLDIYNAEIWHHIQRNWAFSEEMDRGRADSEAVIIVKIMRDGEIRDIWFEKRSGSTYFDESVLKAVKKSNPLPPLPDGFLGPYYDVGFRFNLSELRRRP